MNAPVKEKGHKAPQSFPKPEFTGAEAGMQDFPSSTSRSYNYFKPQKMRADGLRGRHHRRPAGPGSPPQPGLAVRLR